MTLKKSFDEYLKIKAQNWTLLKEMARSPLHYQYRMENPREDSTGLARGRAVHTATLEPELFSKEYTVFTGARRQGHAWDEFQEVYGEDYTILKQDEYDKAMLCAKAIRKHPEAKAIMSGCEFEKSFTWKDKVTGLKCKCRVDGIGESLFDLKTTGNVDARIFGNLAARMLYHGQLSFYSWGTKHSGPVYIIAVEAEPPFDVAVFKLGEDELLVGEELYRGFLTRVYECTNSGVWPGRYPERQRLSLPKYAYGDEEDGSYEIMEDANA